MKIESFIELINMNYVYVCLSSDVDRALSKVQWVQGGGQGCVQVSAAEPQAVHWAAHWVWAQLEELQNKQNIKSYYNIITLLFNMWHFSHKWYFKFVF